MFRAGMLVVTFGVVVLTSRFLHPSGRGAYVIGTLTVTLTGSFVGTMGFAVTHHIGRGKSPERVLVGHGILLSLAIGLLGLGIFVPLGLLFPQDGSQSIAWFSLALPAVLLNQMVWGVLVGAGRMGTANVLQLLPGLLTFLGMALLVGGLSGGLAAAAVAWVGSQWLVLIASLVLSSSIWWPLDLRGWSREHALPILSLTAKLGIVNTMGLLNYRIELLILDAYRGLGAVGVYSVASGLAETLWIASNSLGSVMTADAVRSSPERAAELVARAIRAGIIAVSVLAMLLAAVVVPLVPLVFGKAFSASEVPLLILLPGVVAFAPATLISVYFSIRQGQTRYPMLAAIISAVITAGLAVLLVPGMGPSGAAAATTAGYTIGVGCELFWFLRAAGLPVRSLVPTRRDLTAFRDLVRRRGLASD